MEGTSGRAARMRQTGGRSVPTSKRGILGRLKGDNGPTLV